MKHKDFMLTVGFILLVTIPIILAQIWASHRNADYVERVVTQMQQQAPDTLTEEKVRHEIVALRIENETQGFFWHSLWTSLGPIITALVTLSGALFGLQKYLDTRNKERLDRAAGELKNDLEYLVSDEPWKKAIGVVGLQQFFTPEREPYYARALSALVTAARWETMPEICQVIRVAVEQAVRQLPNAMLRRVSWQYVGLKDADFSGADLSGTDFRDAGLENANLAGCDFSCALLTATRFNGADLRGAKLNNAELAYADFAGADLRRADLSGARLHHAKVWRMDIAEADLRRCIFEVEDIRWDMIRNWRKARFDDDTFAELVARYGPEVGDFRVLLLSWEVPPMVAGGTWTATYHFVRKLRRLGVNVTVVVPWAESCVLPDPFGCEVALVPLGIRPPMEASAGPYGSPSWSPYGSTQAVYGGIYGSAYSGAGIYGSYGSAYEAVQLREGSTVLRLADDFRRRLQRYIRHETFDVVHAQDWITFGAGEAAAKRLKVPWVAHFHSLELDRRDHAPDAVIQRIEAHSVAFADALVAPSRFTAERIKQQYETDINAPIAAAVVPNPLSVEEVSARESGRFESKRVVYLGRLTHQKGADRLRELAVRVNERQYGMFHVYGSGELAPSLQHASNIWYRGNLEWAERDKAFSEATVLVVPSRVEPFGMVVLEAMQHGVPVVYPQDAGVAEVLDAGVPVDTSDMAAMTDAVVRLLQDWQYWEEVVSRQFEAIAAYPAEGQERSLHDLWERLVAARKGKIDAPQSSPVA